MNTEMQKLDYLTRCVNHVSDLIADAQRERFLTPAQAARLKRWKAVRRALHHDIVQLQATLPHLTQLTFGIQHEDAHRVGWWHVKQQTAFTDEGKKDPLNESVGNVSTLSGRVS